VPLNIYNNSLTVSGNGTAKHHHRCAELRPCLRQTSITGVAVPMSIAWQNLTIKRGKALATGPRPYSNAGAILRRHAHHRVESRTAC
jgi:hypothetical protein